MAIKRVTKIFYVIARTFSFFGLPFFRAIRSRIYGLHFNAVNMSVSDRVMIVSAHASASARIEFGAHVELGADSYIDYSGGVKIGDNVAISEGAKIFTHAHTVRSGFSNWHKNPIKFSALEIEKDAWVGAGAMILPGVRKIGRGAVIGAGAVVYRDVAQYEVHVGNPAQLLYVRDISDV